MAYVDEEEVWKCETHPSKRRRHGVCPLCLRDRLVTLCSNCANVRPCDCPEPPAGELKRSRSLAVSSLFLRSKSTHKAAHSLPPRGKSSSSSFWSKLNRKKREKQVESDADEKSSGRGSGRGGDDRQQKITMMMRSKSVGMALFSNFGSLREGGSRSEKTKWWFRGPIKGLKQSKAAKVNHENSPTCKV
uniref:Uncharacterized protein n=1 Tax=Kalanchoe fedtschenkoi TaxID=63787 RepID=A0A7N0UYL4_KALFE